jgi:hypothetical protein
MRLRRPSRPLTVKEWTQRNRERILHPPKLSLWDRFMNQLFEVEEWWCRHVTQRELYRHLDAMRIVLDKDDRPDPADMLQRLREDWNSYPEYYPWGDDDDRK